MEILRPSFLRLCKVLMVIFDLAFMNRFCLVWVQTVMKFTL